MSLFNGATGSTYRAWFRAQLTHVVAKVIARSKEPQSLIDGIAREVELQRAKSFDDFRLVRQGHVGEHYLAPKDLSVSDFPLRRVLVVGSCLAESWARLLPVPADFVLQNGVAELPPEPPLPATSYDFQIVQLPLRGLMPDAQFWRLPDNDMAFYDNAFHHTLEQLRVKLEMSCAWNRRFGFPTFVMNFFVPQQNLRGRFQPRYDLRNPQYFIERLNVELERELTSYDDVHLIDVDAIASSEGRRYIQDDSLHVASHSAVLADCPQNDRDIERIVPIPAITDHYTLRSEAFARATWETIVAMMRTLHRIDEVKLVIVDLDDTLWRGVMGEEQYVDADALEGWPLGVLEALCYLKKRGVLLAIASKNDEARVLDNWDKRIGHRMSLDDFAVRRIDWRPKAEQVAEIIETVNVLPRSVLFIDDNPVERAAVSAAFPEIRTLGAYPYYLRRTLLWAPETQIATVTEESTRRTEMVRQHAARETERRGISRAEFLATLNLRVESFEVRSDREPSFPRLLELLNKTNQFNTTGRRWKRADLANELNRGSRLIGFSADDRFSEYGTIAAAIVDEGDIVQFVMSCRVIGLDVERVALKYLAERAHEREHAFVTAQFVNTEANGVCREMYSRTGFMREDDRWICPVSSLRFLPVHATSEPEDDALAVSRK